MLFVLNQKIYSVERNAAVIADYSAASVRVGKSRNNRRLSRHTHFGRIHVKNALIMRFSVFCEYFHNLGVNLVAVFAARVLRHSYAAERLQRTLKRLIRLKTYNFFKRLVKITRAVRGDSRYNLCIHVEHSARLAFLLG